ncbi:GIY-YIG nuclease family protein [Natranaerofaba carboxydovora]|uniref:GIY-YIG nuclease family protein n=1 Tax=Natranaerofaba carboxydovora TaxID=2742683 RepID=UPI001F1298F7|nr:GIY-YIG nuclease family protein [Natranaerofaba carboxydovora]UMZ73838.1 hypothetical protein ACONDI_01407 [Natranaerofaba carboxydovora]
MSYTFYLIVFELEKSKIIKIGKLGEFHFPPGFYVYIGSGKKNIEARVARHIKKNKKKRWHIDYLSVVASPVEVRFLKDSNIDNHNNYDKEECCLARRLSDMGGLIIVDGFGASDCNCPSHLLYFQYKPIIDYNKVLNF